MPKITRPIKPIGPKDVEHMLFRLLNEPNYTPSFAEQRTLINIAIHFFKTHSDEATVTEDFREKLAKFIHEDIWAHWMKYLFTCGALAEMDGELVFVEGNEPAVLHKGTFCIGPHNVERWTRQMHTDYEDLPEDEKKSDQELADKLIELLEE